MSLIDDLLGAVVAIQKTVTSTEGATVKYAYKYPQWNMPRSNLP